MINNPLVKFSTALAALLAAQSSIAATFFTESFDSDPTAGAGATLELTSQVGTSTADFSGGNAQFLAGGDPARAYYGTLDTDYATVSFIASIEVTVTATNGAQGFFGLGPGVTDGNASGGSFGEPSNGPAIIAATDLNTPPGTGGNVRYASFADGSTGTFTETTDRVLTSPLAQGVHTLSLAYDGTNVTLSVDGTVASTLAAPIELDATNSRIFFGGSRGVSFDNLVIAVPEPSSALLCGLGAIALFARRRK